ncbi:MAG: GWxTD domain-containing protein [Calditrichia bacterium]
MRRLLQTICLVLVLVPMMLQAAPPNENIKMFLDYARFRYDENDTYLEMYYMLYYQDRAAATEMEDVWLGFYFTDTEADTLLSSKMMKVNMAGSPLSGKVGLIKTHIPPGSYRIKMMKFDDTGKVAVDSVLYDFAASPFKSERVTMSDLELCSNVIAKSKNSKSTFYKNTMEVIPNPSKIFGINNPFVNYYIELYNITPSESQPELGIQVAVQDNDGKIFQQKSYSMSRKYESRVEQGAFDIRGLESGWYNILYAVVDSAAEYSVFKFNKFYVLSENKSDLLGQPLVSFEKSQYFGMPLEEVEEKFEQVRYIATKDEVVVYKTLSTVDEKRKYVYDFWNRREKSSPGLQAEYYGRVKEANQQFSFSGLRGWKSDMGRVHIVYGPPSQRERIPSDMRTRPYEIWYYYEMEGGTQFVFVDVNGYDDYRLVTSTVRDEIYDPNWKENYLLVD